MKKEDKQLEKLLFEVYDKGVKQQDCNLTECIKNVKQALRIHDVVGRSEQLKAFIGFAEWYKEEYKQHIPLGAIKEYIKSL